MSVRELATTSVTAAARRPDPAAVSQAADDHLGEQAGRGSRTLPANAMDLCCWLTSITSCAISQSMLRSIGRALKSGGRLAVIEYRKEDPTIPIASTHRIVAGLRTEIEAEPLTFDRLIEDLPRQHLIIFRKPAL